MKRIAAFASAAMLIFLLAGCTGNRVVGKWEFTSGSNKGVMEFFKNGSGLIYDAADSSKRMEFTYEVIGSEKLKLITDGFEEIVEYDLKDDRLNIVSEVVLLEGVRVEQQ